MTDYRDPAQRFPEWHGVPSSGLIRNQPLELEPEPMDYRLNPYRAGMRPIGSKEFWEEPRNGLGVAALITGIIGSLLGLIPILFPLAIIGGVAGLGMALFHRGRIKKERASNYKTNRVAICAGIVAIALGLLGMFIVVAAVDKFGKDMEQIQQDSGVVNIEPVGHPDWD